MWASTGAYPIAPSPTQGEALPGNVAHTVTLCLTDTHKYKWFMVTPFSG